ncbi:MAG: helix-turn-helix transcriptional regulator [Alteromonadaceae bacterium]|uniref:helix-turn-helix domain-containing protein n=1 Tax=Colwellia piezophila TaxID=211668 RepID=UPI0003821CF2|nr:helix-turn-helix transcriptional regulator [Colwellia piezophila]MBL4911449.1 helix-turn-helix transcriptional regulator [Alteromonadaceae bacterium]
MINKALKIIRQFHNLKQVELAESLAISKSYLSEIESGKKPASVELLEKYSKQFDIPMSSLVFFSESLEDKKKIPEKFKRFFAAKILNIMEWVTEREETKKTQV